VRIIFLNGSQTGSTAWPFVDELDIMERYSGDSAKLNSHLRGPQAKLCGSRKGPGRNTEEGARSSHLWFPIAGRILEAAVSRVHEMHRF
jgi:hypothetical protein